MRDGSGPVFCIVQCQWLTAESEAPGAAHTAQWTHGAEVAVQVLVDQAADGQTITEMGTVEDLPLAAQEAPEEEGAPLMGVTTTGGEEAAFTPTSRRS